MNQAGETEPYPTALKRCLEQNAELTVALNGLLHAIEGEARCGELRASLMLRLTPFMERGWAALSGRSEP